MEYQVISRQEEINTLLEIISKKEQYQENSKNGLVILLNGGWGTGKTTFLEEFVKEIENNDDVELFNNYNAYEHDFYEEAYIPFFASINDKVKMEQEVKKLIKTIGKDISKSTIATVIVLLKAIAKHFNVDLDSIESEIDKFGDEKHYDDYLEKYKDFMDFKIKLKEKIMENTSDKKQIFIIDELDRCKPSFAMETLEIVKHFFDIEKCIFIISVDKEQLEESAKTIYGQGINAEKYFSKLYDYQFNLLPLNYNKLIATGNTNEYKYVNLAQQLFDKLSISTRDGKKIMNDFINRTSKHGARSRAILLFLIVLKYTDLSFYKAILKGEYSQYRKLILGEYNNGYSRYYEMIELEAFNKKTYDYILQELTYFLDCPANAIYGDGNTIIINNKEMTKNEMSYDVEAFVPIVDERLTVKENLEKAVG